MQIYNVFINKFDEFNEVINKKAPGARDPNQKKLLNYENEKKSFNPSGSRLKILNKQQMLNCLPILLAQIQAGNNSIKLKNELRQILYSLYRSKTLTKTVYNNLIKIIRAEH